jgi:signal transduction histidine kinase
LTQDLLDLVQLYQQEYSQPTAKIEEKISEIELDYLSEDLPKILSSMRLGAERIRQLVLSLRNFSRLDEAEVKAVDIHEGIDSTLLILHHRLKSKSERSGIELIKNYGKLPKVECYAAQLNQVFMNILSNALDALESLQNQSDASFLPTITIKTAVIQKTDCTPTNWVMISIQDNAGGIPPEVKNKIFDPFFTTKPVGKGTGLGLSISYQIVVEKHKGTLQCESQLGQGTEFKIQIPVKHS